MHYSINLVRKMDINDEYRGDDREQVEYAEIVDMPSIDSQDPNKAQLPNTRLQVKTTQTDANPRCWMGMGPDNKWYACPSPDIALQYAIAASWTSTVLSDKVHRGEEEYTHLHEGDTLAMYWEGKVYAFKTHLKNTQIHDNSNIELNIVPIGPPRLVSTAPSYSVVYYSLDDLYDGLGFGYIEDGWYRYKGVLFLILRAKCTTPQCTHFVYSVTCWKDYDPRIHMDTMLNFPTFVYEKDVEGKSVTSVKSDDISFDIYKDWNPSKDKDEEDDNDDTDDISNVE